MSHKNPADRDLAVAVDIGGTKIKTGLIRRDGTLVGLERVSTPATAAPEDVMQLVLRLTRGLCGRHGLTLDQADGIGISIAAYVTADGKVTANSHLSDEWLNYDLGERLAGETSIPQYFVLDTPAPTLGEAYYGAGKGIDHFAYVTVSTGIGAGIMANGRYYTGGMGWAGGVGHSIIDEKSPRICEGCGNAGCLETFAATQGIIATTLEMLAQRPDSLILELVGGEHAAITPTVVCEAAKQGDAVAHAVWDRVGHMLGIGLVNLIDIVAPRRVVVGGGISQAGDLLLEPARAVIRERAFPPNLREVEIVQAALRDLSGAYGAAAMVFHDLRVNLPQEMA